MNLSRAFDLLRCLLVSAIVIHVGLRWQQSRSHQLAVEEPIARIEDNKALALSTSRRTLILATASYCHFCRESLPFYRRVVPLARQTGIRVVGLATEDLAVNRAYLLSENITIDDVVGSDEAHIPIQGTPTLMLLSSDGSVIGWWRGKLNSSSEVSLINMINSTRVER